MQPAVPQLWPLMTIFHTPTFRAAHGCTNTTYQEKLSWHHTPAISTLPRLELDISHLGDYNVMITYIWKYVRQYTIYIQSIYNLQPTYNLHTIYIESIYNIYIWYLYSLYNIYIISIWYISIWYLYDIYYVIYMYIYIHYMHLYTVVSRRKWKSWIHLSAKHLLQLIHRELGQGLKHNLRIAQASDHSDPFGYWVSDLPSFCISIANQPII